MIKYLQPALISLTTLLIPLLGGFDSSAEIKKEVILHSTKLIFPETKFGDTIEVMKILDTNGGITFRSSSTQIKTPTDLFELEQKETLAKRKKYGPLDQDLLSKIEGLNEKDTIKLKIYLKIHTNGHAPDKTKNPIEKLIEHSKKRLDREPLVDKTTFMKKYKLNGFEKHINKGFFAIANSSDIILTKIAKMDLNSFRFDENIASIEEYVEPVPCQTCGQCQHSTGSYSSIPCFSTLASSAYNPSTSMPSDALGQGVKAATFEIGIRSNFVTCMNAAHLISYDAGSNGVLYQSHSDQCFRCLANAAPQASLYHRSSLSFDGTADENYIINNGIETVSMSYARNSNPQDGEMRHIDMWAYRYPYTVFCNPTANSGYCAVSDWRCYNAINVGNVMHSNQNHYVLADTALDVTANCSVCGTGIECNGHCRWGATQTANPAPRYSSYSISQMFDCSSCNPGTRSDRELPMLVAPGISPIRYLGSTSPMPAVSYPSCGYSIMSDPCIYNDAGTQISCPTQGTSYSAPITNGIAACLISANRGVFGLWPEKVRAALLVTAENVDFNYWSDDEDGRDGAGVISGSNAVWFARNCTNILVAFF
ncbi:MAG: S8 family serine peptidase [Chitinispirillaceae bacterium]|nr:S8 family serine peptidase [Chitinispirillaceae bacterium]